MTEKRRFARFRVALKVKCIPHGSVQEYEAIGENISMGGVKIALDKSVEIPAEASVALQLYLPKVILELQGKVAWIEDTDGKRNFGIKFQQLPDRYKEDIYDFVSRYGREQLTRMWWKF